MKVTLNDGRNCESNIDDMSPAHWGMSANPYDVGILPFSSRDA